MMTQEKYMELSSRLKDTVSPDKIRIVEGLIPILLSVPHAVSHMREGTAKPEEVNTDVLGFAINEHTGCHLFMNAGVEGDPNYDESSIYKNRLLEYAVAHNIQMVIDIHGSSAERDFDYELGTGMGENLNGFDQCVSAFTSLSSLLGLSATVDTVFPAASHRRISSFVCSRTSIPSLQIEINYKRREDVSSISVTVDLISRYVQGLAALLSLSKREEHMLMWPVKAEMFIPRNLAILPESMRDRFRLNDGLEVCMGSENNDLIVKDYGVPEGCIGLSNQLLYKYGIDNGHVLIRNNEYASHSILKPKAEEIDNVYALLSDDIYEKYKSCDILEVLNPVDNLRAYFKFKKYEGNINGRENAVWLNYYQRKLLGLEVPPVISHEYMLKLLSLMNDSDADFFRSLYQFDRNEDCFVRTVIDAACDARLRNIWKVIYGNARFRGLNTPAGGIKQSYLMEKLIRKSTMQFRTARCTDNNEIIDAIFISKSSAIILGVSELDYVWISHKKKSVRTKVVIIEKEDYPKIVKANGLKSDEEIDMIVCIPTKIRMGLDIYESGTSVMIERSVKDLFIKNAFAQMMTLLGLFIAIVSIPDLTMFHKVIIFFLLGPLIMYSVLAGERNRI